MNSQLEALAKTLGDVALKARMMVTTAESCTAGGISYTITDIAGSSQWFDRGFVTYTNASKMDLLGVSASTLEAVGAVSSECASEMVLGALAHSNADIAVAVTGIAGPGGAVPGKPVGTVFLAWGRRGEVPEVVRKEFPGDRQAVRTATIQCAIEGLIQRISQ